MTTIDVGLKPVSHLRITVTCMSISHSLAPVKVVVPAIVVYVVLADVVVVGAVVIW